MSRVDEEWAAVSAAGLLLRAFRGRTLPAEVAAELADGPVAGFTLFRQHNIGTAAELRGLTDALQAAAPAEHRPLLVAADQEGGQLQALGDFSTPFAGAMALGATGDEALAERVARAVGRELRALGVNVDYAPVCDLASQPQNPALGIRSFGDDPRAVAGMVAATVRGLQAEGVAATLKHFPGMGQATLDTHHGLAVVELSREELEQRELVPFRAGLAAGAKLVMSGHYSLPALTGRADLPATLSADVIRGLLRDELGFRGLAITDALDMKALAGGPAHVVELISAVRAGQDLLLGTATPGLPAAEPALRQALRRELISVGDVRASAQRLADLRRWLAGFGEQPALEIVGSREHRDLAGELARRSITLLRDDAGLLPLRLPSEARVAVIMPRPADLTPADTSSFTQPRLAELVHARHARTDEMLTDIAPSRSEIAALRQRAADYDLLLLGTISAHLQPAQAKLARALLEAGRPTVTLALRTPWDLAAYPASTTHLCSYGLLEPSLRALVGVLWGDEVPTGRLPVAITGLYPRGHGLSPTGVAAWH